MSDNSEMRRALRRLALATQYLIKNYLEDERADQRLCWDQDHWAAINLAHDAAKDALVLIGDPTKAPAPTDNAGEKHNG